MTVLHWPSSNLVLSSISYNMASEKVLNWLYSVLVNVIPLAAIHIVCANKFQEYSDVNRTYHDAAEALSNCTSHASQLHDSYTNFTPTSRPVAFTKDRTIYVREWLLGASLASQRHGAGHLSRRNIRVPGSDMGASVVPPRTTHRIRHASAGHGVKTWTTREHRWQDIPPVSGTMGKVLGCEYRMRLESC